MVRLLSPESAARLRAAPYTYAAVGATAGTRPPGHRHLTRSRVLPGRDLATVANLLMTWQLQERAGLSVAASSHHVEPDAVVEMRLGAWPWGLRMPCRVVYVVDEADRAGFAYGTLPGHPESGEELFTVERHEDGVVVTITAFSRPATWLARAGGPLTRAFQDAVTMRYLRVLGHD